MSLTPSSILNPDDPGDDTQRRFRYQNTYAGILGILMSDDAKDITEIYCEHHDDILVKDISQKYVAIQVKTKDINLRPFDISDEAIDKSFKRFVNLDLKFPDQFKRFSIVSNHGFDKTSKASCIQSMIDHYLNVGVHNSQTNFGKFVKQISEHCNCSIEEVIETIKKIKLQTFSSLEDIHIKLLNCIRSCPHLQGITESKVSEIADIILSKFYKASSLYQEETDTALLYMAGVVSDDELLKTKILSKKLNVLN